MDLVIERLIECRKRLGITKQEAAKRIGVSQPAYLRYESGDRSPSIQVIKEIAKVYNTSPDYLLGKSESPESYTVTVDNVTNPVLFEVVQHCSEMDEKNMQRILAYIKKI